MHVSYKPCMLINWPSFSAAPRIWDNLETRRFTLPSVNMSDDAASSFEGLVERRTNSEAIPYPSDAARPAKERPY